MPIGLNELHFPKLGEHFVLLDPHVLFTMLGTASIDGSLGTLNLREEEWWEVNNIQSGN